MVSAANDAHCWHGGQSQLVLWPSQTALMFASVMERCLVSCSLHCQCMHVLPSRGGYWLCLALLCPAGSYCCNTNMIIMVARSSTSVLHELPLRGGYW